MARLVQLSKSFVDSALLERALAVSTPKSIFFLLLFPHGRHTLAVLVTRMHDCIRAREGCSEMMLS